jgi:EmrB/QacA subfamily drug resistance transporter
MSGFDHLQSGASLVNEGQGRHIGVMSTQISQSESESPGHPTAETSARLILTPLMLGTLAYGVLGTIIVPALPFFERVLHTSETGVTWLITAYLLGAAAATAVLGRLGDMFGKRRMLIVTLVVLAIGTIISGVTDSIGWQIVGRVVQGVAGGLLPLSFGIIRDEFPKERVAGAIGRLGSMIALGVFGVILPGLLVPHLNWHWLFWIPLFLTLLALAGVWRFVPESPIRTGGQLNWLNALLMMAGITGFVLGISEGSTWGWTSAKTLGCIIGGVAVAAAWVLAELMSNRPLINLRLMRLRGVWTTNVVAFMIGAGMYSAFAVYPIYAELPKATGFAYGASMLRCGLYLLPSAVAAAVTMPFAGRLAQRIGATRCLILGCVIQAIGFSIMAIWYRQPYDMMISYGLAGLGLGIAFPVLSTVVVQAVPMENVGETTGMNTLVRMLGGAVGTQIVAALISSNTHLGLPTLDGFTYAFAALAAFLFIAAFAARAVSVQITAHATK